MKINLATAFLYERILNYYAHIHIDIVGEIIVFKFKKSNQPKINSYSVTNMNNTPITGISATLETINGSSFFININIHGFDEKLRIHLPSKSLKNKCDYICKGTYRRPLDEYIDPADNLFNKFFD